MKIVKMSEAPKGSLVSSMFTGPDVTRQPLIPESKGVRNKFHAHEGEQILIVTAGEGIVATEDEEVIVTRGDVILIPAGKKHWHGATENSEFSHIYLLRARARLTQLEAW